jgi:hypothetical protein
MKSVFFWNAPELGPSSLNPSLVFPHLVAGRHNTPVSCSVLHLFSVIIYLKINYQRLLLQDPAHTVAEYKSQFRENGSESTSHVRFICA